MKLKIFGAAVAALLATFSPARADVVYTYFGNPFTQFNGSYQCPPHCALTLSFQLVSPLGSNFSGDVVPAIYNFTDGSTVFTPGNSFFNTLHLDTNGSGAITGWEIEAFNNSGDPTMFSRGGALNFDGSVRNLDGFASAVNSDVPGRWTEASISSGVPELSTWAMMLIGFAGIGFLAYRRGKRLVAA